MLISESFSRWRKHRSCDKDNVNEVNIRRKNKKKANIRTAGYCYSERQNAKSFVVITVRRNSHISQLLVNYSVIICYNSNSYVSNLFGETLEIKGLIPCTVQYS